jgi:hypothetical protein
MSGATVIPVSITMSFLDNHLPGCLITLGAPIPPGRRDVMDMLEQRMTQGLDAHVEWLDKDPRPDIFETLVSSRVVPHERRPAARVYLAMSGALKCVLGSSPRGRRDA